MIQTNEINNNLNLKILKVDQGRCFVCDLVINFSIH